MKQPLILALALLCFGPAVCRSERNAQSADLSAIASKSAWTVVNATYESLATDGRQAVRLKATGDSANGVVGLAWPSDLKFRTGTIEVDLKGKSVFQASFLGVVFNLVDEKNFEAVYFRPFNFNGNSVHRGRSVQYISWPGNTWENLRKNKPGQFEKPVDPVPDPDQWFHARVEVTDKQVRVFINDAKKPSLVVSRLNQAGENRPVGLFVDSADGLYANLKVSVAD